MIEPQRVHEVQENYYDLHIIANKSPLVLLFTNQFIGDGAARDGSDRR
jgi:hypothetical protein